MLVLIGKVALVVAVTVPAQLSLAVGGVKEDIGQVELTALKV